jgi:cyclohexadieny/prephenate dehydrogenase
MTLTPAKMPFSRIAIIGLGLIGSSLARAIKAADPSCEIIGFDGDAEVRTRAAALNLANVITTTAADAVQGADLVMLCTPVRSFAELAQDIMAALMPGAVISDVGSVKAYVLETLQAHLPPTVHIIPAHPVAGTEKSGPDAGFATLFKNRWCILTPPENTDATALEKTTQFWQALGANVESMEAKHHDLVLAVTSHIPHLIAYTIVGTASDLEGVTKSEVIKYSAGGFRDFTRIAASDPTMWRDVFLTNKDAVLEVLQRLSEDISLLQRAIRWGEGDTLFELFTRTRDIRRSIIDAGQDTANEDFGRPHEA